MIGFLLVKHGHAVIMINTWLSNDRARCRWTHTRYIKVKKTVAVDRERRFFFNEGSEFRTLLGRFGSSEGEEQGNSTHLRFTCMRLAAGTLQHIAGSRAGVFNRL